MSWQPIDPKMVSAKFSVIVPAFNEEKVISKKLENCMALDYNKGDYEILVVDDYSSDRTAGIVGNYARKHKIIKLIKNRSSKGKVGCVNTALKFAKHEYIAITDADVMLKKNILKKSIKHISKNGIGAICGIQQLVAKKNGSAFDVEDAYRKIYTRLRLFESWVDSAPVFHGQFMVLKKSVIEKLPAFYDDSDIAMKIRKLGYKAKYARECVFYEDSLNSLKDLKSQKERRGTGLILVLMNNKDALFNPKYGIYGLLIFPFEFGLYTLQPFLFFAALAAVFFMLLLNARVYSFVYLLSLAFLYFVVPFIRSCMVGNAALMSSLFNIIFSTKKAKDIYTNCNWSSNRIDS